MESTYLALGEHGLDVRPCGALRGITEQVHDDGTLLDRLIHLEEILAWHPAILLRLFPALSVLAHTNDHVETVVAQVQALAVALRAVADEREGVVLEVVLIYPCQIESWRIYTNAVGLREACHEASHRALQKVRISILEVLNITCRTVHDFLVSSKVDSFHAPGLLHKRGCSCFLPCWSSSADGSSECPLLNARGGNLLQRATQSPARMFGGHIEGCGVWGSVMWEWYG